MSCIPGHFFYGRLQRGAYVEYLRNTLPYRPPMTRRNHFLLLFAFLFSCSTETSHERATIAAEIAHSMRAELLDKWYPQAIDTEYGGFITTYTYDFKPTGDQDKMIVTQ